MCPAVPARNARKDQLRRPAQRPSAFLADGWPDEREVGAAACTQGKVTPYLTNLAGRRKKDINDTAEERHAGSVTHPATWRYDSERLF